MGKRKQKRGKREKKGTSKLPVVLGALLVLSGIIAAFLSWFTAPPTGKRPHPYEEIYSRPLPLSTHLSNIDHAIHGCLQKSRIPKHNIRFVTVKSVREKGREWEFTELLIKPPKGIFDRELDARLDTALSSLKPEVIYRSERISESEKAYHVFALGLYTHKIRLASLEDQRAHYKGQPRIAILIDDIGFDLNLARSFMQLGLPVTLSVLPLAPDTPSIVQMARERDCEYMLHLPMEPKEYPHIDPGPGALFTKMGDDEIRQALSDHLKRVPGARGVNNHMGSEFTENEGKMMVLLQEMKKRGLFYVDSRTTTQTVAERIAKSIGVPVARRMVFLDNDLSFKAIEFQIGRLLAAARDPGAAIGIGHPHKETLNFLKMLLNETKSEARVVPVSQIVG